MDELKEIYAKIDQYGKELTEMRALIDTEKRSPTDDERERSVKLTDQLFSLNREAEEMQQRAKEDEALRMLHESKRMPIKPDVGSRSGGGEKKGFRSFGEFLQAVYAASQPESRLDPRLIRENRAISGMSEAVPADGGLA